MDLELKRDRKGPCWVLSHTRGGYHEQIWLTDEELVELSMILNKKTDIL